MAEEEHVRLGGSPELLWVRHPSPVPRGPSSNRGVSSALSHTLKTVTETQVNLGGFGARRAGEQGRGSHTPLRAMPVGPGAGIWWTVWSWF